MFFLLKENIIDNTYMQTLHIYSVKAINFFEIGIILSGLGHLGKSRSKLSRTYATINSPYQGESLQTNNSDSISIYLSLYSRTF